MLPCVLHFLGELGLPHGAHTPRAPPSGSVYIIECWVVGGVRVARTGGAEGIIGTASWGSIGERGNTFCSERINPGE